MAIINKSIIKTNPLILFSEYRAECKFPILGCHLLDGCLLAPV